MTAPVPAFDLFAPGSAGVLVLLGMRVGGLVLVAPVFSARTVPATVRTGLVVLFTLLLQPAALASAAGAQVTPAAALGETLVGFAIGMGAAVLVGAAEAAGEFMTTSAGLNGAAIMDPLNGGQVPALGQFMQIFAILMLLASDAHLLMLDSVAESTRFIPVGSAVSMADGLQAMLTTGGSMFLLGLRFAAPVIASVMIANVALAVLSRAAPQLNILSIAFPLQIGLGLVALAAALPLTATFFAGWEGAYDALLDAVLGALRPGAAGAR